MIAAPPNLDQNRSLRLGLSEFSCQNPECSHYLKKGLGNLRVDSYYGKFRFRLLYCRVCRGRFSERKGSLLFGSQLPPETVAQLLSFLEQGRGVRETARILGVNRNTVMRYKRHQVKPPPDGQRSA